MSRSERAMHRKLVKVGVAIYRHRMEGERFRELRRLSRVRGAPDRHLFKAYHLDEWPEVLIEATASVSAATGVANAERLDTSVEHDVFVEVFGGPLGISDVEALWNELRSS